jgi:hypothetical protein
MTKSDSTVQVAQSKRPRSFQELFALIENENLRKKVEDFHLEHETLMKEMPASRSNHHCWIGGYYDHIHEVCNNVVEIVINLPLSPWKFTLDDLIVAAYFHDVDKLFCRYVLDPDKPSPAQVRYATDLGIVIQDYDNKTSVSWKIDAKKEGRELDERRIPYFVKRTDVPAFVDTVMVAKICGDFGVDLSDMALHGITFHQGGWSSGIERDMNMEQIAAVLHSADFLSAMAQNGEGNYLG